MSLQNCTSVLLLWLCQKALAQRFKSNFWVWTAVLEDRSFLGWAGALPGWKEWSQTLCGEAQEQPRQQWLLRSVDLQLYNKSVLTTGVTSLQSSGYLKFSTPLFLYLFIQWALLRSMNSLGNAKTLILAETALQSYSKGKLKRFSVMWPPSNPAVTHDILYQQKHPSTIHAFLSCVITALSNPFIFYKYRTNMDNPPPF